MRVWRGLIFSLVWAALGVKMAAAAICDAPSESCVQVGRWNVSLGLGLGMRSNPVIGHSDIPLVVVPKVSYYGKRFFLENLEAGVTLYENDNNGINLMISPGYDRVFFYRTDPQNFFVSGGLNGSLPPGGPPPPPPTRPPESDADRILKRSRQVTLLAGPEWHFDFHSLVGQFDALYEITGRYSGAEIRGALALPLIESHGVLRATAGGTWKSAALVTYYYGEHGIYDAPAAFSPFAKLSYELPLRGHWGLDAFAHYEWLGDSITRSPIVHSSHVITYFAGVTYSF